MMRESRRRSPQAESSRRRRRDRERDRDRDPNRRSSRDQPTTTTTAPTADTPDYYRRTGTSDSYSRGIKTEDRDRSAPFAADSAPVSQPWIGENPNYYTAEPEPIPHSSQLPQPRSRARAHARVPSSSGSDSSSPSYLDISRRYDTSRFGGVLTAFFRAPSEHRRQQRRVKNKAKKRAVFPFSNSSSSSVNSDLAYGDGFIPQSKSSSRRSRSDGRPRNESGDPFQPGKLQRRQTDEEIVAIGRQLSDLAKRQNDEDLRAAGRSRPSKIMSAAAGLATLNEVRRGKKDGTRGIGSSKPHGGYSDDEDWESATDDDSSDDDASALAYGASKTNLPGVLGGAAAAAAGAGALWASQSGRRASGLQPQQQQRRQGVDPSLFGPVNSLNGMVTPIPFRDEDRYNDSGYDRRRDAPPTVVDSVANAPMREVFPVPTSQPDQFDARHSASLTGSRTDDVPKVARPGPAPIQAPVPISPVPSKVYNAQSLEEAGRREARERRHTREDEPRGMSSAAKMSFGTAATAVVAAAALKSYSQRGRDEDYRSYAKVAPKKLHRGERPDQERRRSERDLDLSRDVEREARRREREREKDRDGGYEKEHRKSKDSISKSKEDREYKRTSRDYDDRSSKRSEAAKEKDRRSSKYDRDEIKVEYDDDDKTSRRSRREEKMPAERDLAKDIAAGAIVAGGAALAAGAFASSSSHQGPERPLTPAVFTVDREPSFDDWPPRSPSPDVRLSRKDSFEMEKMAEDSARQASRSGREYEDIQREAMSIYDEAKQATVPVGAAAVAAAVAAETNRGRERRRDEYSDDGSRERSAPAKDAVQEEADRYYREAEAARKIAEEEARSRSRSKGSDRGSKDDEEPEITIVTPPGYEEDKKLEKSPYDAPNADVRIDNQIYPADTHRFRASGSELDAPVFKSRDPSAERERPLLNLVMPTPLPSREPTPAPSTASASAPSEEGEQNDRSSKKSKKDRKKDKKDKKRRDRGEQPDAPEPEVEVIIGPKGDIIQTPSTPKSVTWGENETKSYEVESPEQERKESSDKERPRLNKTSKWGILAAAIAGSSTEPANEPEPMPSDTFASRALPSDAGGRGLEDIGDPPIPGPKPGSTDSKQMPGGFADDVEFAGTLAAGLEDAGFDPNIVVNDPTYRRRESPPGSDELHESGFYKKGFSSTVEDLSQTGEPMTPGSGFVIGETETPKEEGTDGWGEVPAKLSKKEKRKQEKLAASKRQSVDFEDTAFSQPAEPQTTEEFTEFPLSKKEQKKRAKAAKAKALAGDDDWETAGQGSETPTSQTQGTETPPSWEAGEDDWEASSKKKKGKNRKSKDYSELDTDKVSVPVDAFSDIQSSRDNKPEEEWDVPKKKKKSRGSTVDSPSHSAPASEVGSESGSKKKSKRRSLTGDDFNQWDGDPPDKRRVDPFEERDVSSVVSEPRYDDRRRESKSKRSSRFDDDDDTKSIASAPGGSRKSKDSEKRSSGIFSSIFSKSNGHKDDGKKDSFLDNAGTLGAGVGLAGAAAVIASAASSRQHATEASSEIEQPTIEGPEPTREVVETFDPEIAPRIIKPAIDPQYGDLLPLPPSEPGSPKEAPTELPELPDSRPDTPPEERNLREQERMVHVRRRSAQELPVKSPSRTAIPIQLRLGPRSNPSTPGFLKSSPLNSPSTPDSTGPSKRPGRPTSWDSSRGPIPLQLPRHVRHGSTDAATHEADVPAFGALRDLTQAAVDPVDAGPDDGLTMADRSLHLDIGDSQLTKEFAGSQESTPKAEIRPEFPILDAETSHFALDTETPGDGVIEALQGETEPEPVEPMSKNRSSYLLNSTPSSIRSDRSVDPEFLTQSPPQQSTPSKQRSLGADLSDIPEDLTSADEHFSDAREGHSEDDFFEEARSAFSSELSGGSPSNTTPTRATFAETVPVVAEPPSADLDQESVGVVSKKRGKKGKKKAGKASATAAAWDTPEDESLVSTPQAGPSVADKTLASEDDIPAFSVSASESYTNPKPKLTSSEALSRETLTEDETTERETASTDNAAGETEFAMAPSKKDRRKKKKEMKNKPSEDTAILSIEAPEIEEVTGATLPQDPKLDIQDTEASNVQKELALSRDAYFPSAAGLHVAKDKTESPVKDNDGSGYFPSAARVLPVVVPVAVAAGISMRDSWDSKPGENPVFDKDEPTTERSFGFKSGIEDPMHNLQVAGDTIYEDQERTPVEIPVSEPLFSQGDAVSQESQDRDSSLESTQVVEDAPLSTKLTSTPPEEPAEDEWSALVSTRKSKKNKKKKGAPFSALEDDLPPSDESPEKAESLGTVEEPGSASAEPSQVPVVVDTQGESSSAAAVEAEGDEWAAAATSKKKGKKNKKKQTATFPAWDEPQPEEFSFGGDASTTSQDVRPVVEKVGTSLDETTQDVDAPSSDLVLAPEPPTEDFATFNPPKETDDRWASTTTSKKKGKKSKKKDSAAYTQWNDDAKSEELPNELGESRTLAEAEDLPKGEPLDTEEPPPTKDVETLGSDPSPEPNIVTDSQAVQAEDEWALPKTGKEKKKDKKKKRQALVLATDDDSKIDQSGFPGEQPVRIASPVLASSENDTRDQDAAPQTGITAVNEPVDAVALVDEAVVSSDPAVERKDESVQESTLEPPVAPSEPVEDDWAPISKKDKKKKNKKRLSATTWEDEPTPPAEEQQASSHDPITDSQAPPADPEAEFEVSKKAKKGKKNKNNAFSNWDEEPATTTQETPEESPAGILVNTKEATSDTVADPEAEFGTPKSKKKGKKGKSASTFDSWADESAEAQEAPQETVAENLTPLPLVADNDAVEKPDDTEAATGASEDLRLLTSKPQDGTSAEDALNGNDLEVPASGALFAVNDLASPLKPTLSQPALASMDSIIGETTPAEHVVVSEDVPYDQVSPPVSSDQAEQAPPAADDSEFLFPMKKKGKKAKKENIESDRGAVAAEVLSPDEARVAIDVGAGDAEEKVHQPPEGTHSDEAGLSTKDSVIEPVSHAEADSGFVVHPAKKDKKKKKKGKALTFDEPITTEPESSSLADAIPGTTIIEHPLEASEIPDPQLSVTFTEAQTESEWNAPSTSKKDKKKKKKQSMLDWSQEDVTPKDDLITPVSTLASGEAQDTAEPSAGPESTPVESGSDHKPSEDTKDAEAEWAAPVLSKKDKKKKKKQAELDWTQEDTPEGTELAAAGSGDPVPDIAGVQTETSVDEAWNTPALSKKDKKKKKKAAAMLWADEETAQDVPESTEAGASSGQELHTAHDAAETKNLVSEPVSAKTLDTSQDPSGLPSSSIDDPETELGFSLSKKDKKNKKKAKSSAVEWLDEEPGQAATEAPEPAGSSTADRYASHSDQHGVHSSERPASWEAANVDWPDEPTWEDQGPPREEDEDSWDVTAPKSKKKKKKQAITEEVVLDEAPAPESRRASEVIIADTVEASASLDDAAEDDDDEWAALVTGTKSTKPDEPEDLPWAHGHASSLDQPSDPKPAWGDEAGSRDIVPESIATVNDLRHILSGAGSDDQKQKNKIAFEELSEGGPAEVQDPALTSTEPDSSKPEGQMTLDDDSRQPDDAEPALDTTVPQDQENEPAIAVDVEDQAPTVEPVDNWMETAKLSKKDKKKKKKQQSMAWDDATERLPATVEIQADAEPETDKKDADQLQLAKNSGEPAAEHENPETPASQPEPDFDDWAPKKLSKKDKKKAEKAARLAALEDEEAHHPVVESTTAPESEPLKRAVSAEIPIPAPDGESVSDDWTPKKLSKKEQKKAEKAARLAALEAEEFVPESTEKAISSDPETATKETVEQHVTPSIAPETEVNDWNPEQLTEEVEKKTEKAVTSENGEALVTTEPSLGPVEDQSAVLKDEEPLRTETTPAEQQPEFDEWAPKLSKKDKKKAEKAARLAALATVDAPSEHAEPRHEETDIAVITQPGVTERSPATENDDWAPKKSKKDKKKAAKAAQLAAINTPEPESEASHQPAQVEELVQAEKSVEAQEPVISGAPTQEQRPELDEGASKLSKKEAEEAEEAGRQAESSVDETPTALTESPALPAVEEPDVVPAEQSTPSEPVLDLDDWAPKMSKKDKKKAEKAARLAAKAGDSNVNTQQVSMASTDEVLMSGPVQETTHEQAQEPVEKMDEWAPKLSKKDKKKAEKAARLAALTHDEQMSNADQFSATMATPLETPDASQLVQDSQPDMDDWASEKKSKKEKKKADEIAKSAYLMSEDTPVDPLSTDVVMEDVKVKDEEPSTAAKPIETQPELDEWAPKKTSKKDKKKAEKLARAAALSTGLAVAGDALSLSNDKTDELEASAEAPQPENQGQDNEPSSSEAVESSISEMKHAPAPVSYEMDQNEASPELYVDAAPVVASDSNAETRGLDSVLLAHPQASTEEVAVAESQDPTVDPSDLAPLKVTQAEAVTLEAAPEDNTWALPVKKNGKKKKKDLAEDEDSAESRIHAEQGVDQVEVAREISTEPVDAHNTAHEEAAMAGEDTWAMPVKISKKSKKGKKKGSQVATPSETPRVASPIQEELDLKLPPATGVSEPSELPVSVEEDPWEMSARGGKKGKKGKKMASQGLTPTETPRAPSPSHDDGEALTLLPENPTELADQTSPEAVNDALEPPSRPENEAKGAESGPSATIQEHILEDAPAIQTPFLPGNPSQEHAAEVPAAAPAAVKELPHADMDLDSNRQESPMPAKLIAAVDSAADIAREPAQEINTATIDEPLTTTRSSGKHQLAVASPTDDRKGDSHLGAWGAAAAGTAAAGGVAAIAEKFGGGKKKKASKKKKIVDKRQPREDDLFDDPALWESADKKGLDDVEVPKETEDFWKADDTEGSLQSGADNCGQAEDVSIQEQAQGEEANKGALPTPSSNSPASESGWKETSRQGARLDDEFEESLIRGEKDTEQSTATGLLRLASDASEPQSGLLREDSQPRSLTSDKFSDSPDLKRSPSRGLPVVPEVPEAETEPDRALWTSPEVNRDSGFVTDSPNPLNRRSKTFEELRDEPQRDSGIHTEDWDETTPHTPGNLWEHKLRRSPQSTPRLREPMEQAATPEPEKRRAKNYGSLADEATPSRGISGPGAAAAAALAAGAVAASTAAQRDLDQRSFSEGHARSLREQESSSPSPSLTSHRAEPSLRRTASNTSIVRHRTPEPLKFRPESPGIRSTPTPPLRRVNRRISTELPPASASRETNTPKPVANETKVRVRDKDKDMTDVYDGFGEGRIGSPRSPTRPHSMRRRQSMQVLELESKVEQLLAENRLLSDARNHAEQNLSQRATSLLSERDAEIETLKQSLQFLQNEVSRLTEVNEGLTSANAELASKDNSRYAGLEASTGDASRGLDLAAGGAAGAAAGAAATVASYQQSIQEKDDEIADLRAQLEDAKERVRDMQRQILASKAGEAEFLEILDEDHFDHRCQQLCSHVQQWVLRFSKFSDMRACRLTSEINDEKTIDRLDNAVLDGSDVDVYLKDRVRRRDIFMSMTMNMIWEFVFTRYLFGMDREQRQKLKSLEKLLTEVGPPQAVRQWRAVTLTLLSRRRSFKEQRDLDTEAVVQAIFQTLCKILPPPSNLEDQIQSQLRRVMAEAVALSIQMRTQKAEYMMLPPLQPEYDADGELAASVYFNASMMNERSGNSTVSNEELEAQQAKVRIVLFPLVVKKGDDSGVGDEEIVVCPAQVVVASRHSRRSIAPSSDAGGASLGGAPSRVSVVTEHMT